MRHPSFPLTLCAIAPIIAAMNALQTQAHFNAIPWKPREVVLASLVAAGGIIALNGVVVAVNVTTGNSIRENGDALAIFLILQAAIILGAAWLFSVARYRVGWNRLGLQGFPVAAGCALSVAFFVASYFVRLVYAGIAYALGFRFGVQQVLTRLDTTGVGFLLTLVVGAVIAPIAEEVFFRGFVYAGLRARLGVAAAVLVASLFFTILHLSVEFFIPLFALGIFLTLLYEMTGSLFPGILLHATNNAIALVAYVALKAMGIPLG